jgi:hypothetical protein
VQAWREVAWIYEPCPASPRTMMAKMA